MVKVAAMQTAPGIELTGLDPPTCLDVDGPTLLRDRVAGWPDRQALHGSSARAGLPKSKAAA